MNSNCEMQGNVEFTVESEKCNPKFILKTHDNAGPPYCSLRMNFRTTIVTNNRETSSSLEMFHFTTKAIKLET